jgi:hypothetical protein
MSRGLLAGGVFSVASALVFLPAGYALNRRILSYCQVLCSQKSELGGVLQLSVDEYPSLEKKI